jgi:hypothetical protein
MHPVSRAAQHDRQCPAHCAALATPDCLTTPVPTLGQSWADSQPETEILLFLEPLVHSDILLVLAYEFGRPRSRIFC